MKKQEIDLEASARGYFRLTSAVIEQMFKQLMPNVNRSRAEAIRFHEDNIECDRMLLKHYCDCSTNFEYDKLVVKLIQTNVKHINELLKHPDC